MATTSSNVWWGSPDVITVGARVFTVGNDCRLVEYTATPEPPHENPTIQRMSEAWRALEGR